MGTGRALADGCLYMYSSTSTCHDANQAQAAGDSHTRKTRPRTETEQAYTSHPRSGRKSRVTREQEAASDAARAWGDQKRGRAKARRRAAHAPSVCSACRRDSCMNFFSCFLPRLDTHTTRKHRSESNIVCIMFNNIGYW